MMFKSWTPARTVVLLKKLIVYLMLIAVKICHASCKPLDVIVEEVTSTTNRCGLCLWSRHQIAVLVIYLTLSLNKYHHNRSNDAISDYRANSRSIYSLYSKVFVINSQRYCITNNQLFVMLVRETGKREKES